MGKGYSRFDSSLIQTKLMDGADPNVVFNRINDTEVWPNSLGLRPLHLVFFGGQGRAFKRHQLRAIRSLLTYGADVHATMHNGNTPLHLAYQFSKTDPNPHKDHNASCGCPIGVLLSWGADTMALNSNGETPEACYKSDQERIRCRQIQSEEDKGKCLDIVEQTRLKNKKAMEDSR